MKNENDYSSKSRKTLSLIFLAVECKKQTHKTAHKKKKWKKNRQEKGFINKKKSRKQEKGITSKKTNKQEKGTINKKIQANNRKKNKQQKHTRKMNHKQKK